VLPRGSRIPSGTHHLGAVIITPWTGERWSSITAGRLRTLDRLLVVMLAECFKLLELIDAHVEIESQRVRSSGSTS